MARIQKIICTLAIATTTASAFTNVPLHQRSCRQLSHLNSDKDSGGGGSAIATPKTKQVTTTIQKSEMKQKQKKKFKPSEPEQIHDFEDAPMYRLYLIGDEEYGQEHTVTRMFEVVEDCSEDDAATLFKSAMQTGEAFMGKYPLEVAETYAEQLTRSDPIIYADVRDDKNQREEYAKLYA